MANRSKIYGVGLNDSNYPVRIHEMVNGKARIVYECPIFVTWKDMMKRCYSEAYHKIRPTYKGCKVCWEWLSFMNFHSWAKDRIGTDPSGKKLQLDKDFLVEGNKVYSPLTCVFIPHILNNFISKDEKTSSSGYKGVELKKGKYLVWCCDPLKRDNPYVGTYPTASSGSEAFISRKLYYLDNLQDAGYVPIGLYERVKDNILQNSGEYK